MIKALKGVVSPTKLEFLTCEQLVELQRGLSALGYPLGEIDGLLGPKTKTAWAEFKTDLYPGNPTLIGPEAINVLDEQFILLIPSSSPEPLNKDEVAAAIAEQCRKQKIGLETQIAYVLATVQWETAQTFKPVKEAFWKDEEWRRAKLAQYFPFYGRGYVQLTWKNNYRKYSNILGVDLVSNPDLALKHEIALFILVHGFKCGTFTGKKITDYINKNSADFINARRCINGMDHAEDIAKIADKFVGVFG